MNSKKRKTVQARINKSDKKIIDDYIKKNNITISTFIRNTLLEKISNEKNLER